MAETGQGVWHWQQAEQTTLYSVLLNNGDFFIPLESPAEWGIISAFAVPVGGGGGAGVSAKDSRTKPQSILLNKAMGNVTAGFALTGNFRYFTG